MTPAEHYADEGHNFGQVPADYENAGGGRPVTTEPADISAYMGELMDKELRKVKAVLGPLLDTPTHSHPVGQLADAAMAEIERLTLEIQGYQRNIKEHEQTVYMIGDERDRVAQRLDDLRAECGKRNESWDRIQSSLTAERDALQARLAAVDAMWLQCRQDYGRLVHAIGCIEDDPADEVLEAANRLWEENRDKQCRIAAAVKIVDDWHRTSLSGVVKLSEPGRAIRSALKGETP